jgi:hypothetical protein
LRLPTIFSALSQLQPCRRLNCPVLEAAFFCSFAPLSTITFMADHSGRDDLKPGNFFWRYDFT